MIMRGLEFPITSTKVPGLTKSFDLADPEDRKKYFQAKVGKEITAISKYLEDHTFMGFFLGKKNAGKGTYSSLLREIFGTDKIATVALGDLVREIHANWDDYKTTDEYQNLKKFYRGYISFDEAVERLHGRSQSTLLPTEFVLALLKTRIAKVGKKAIFLDGLPRDIDQISYSLFLRDLANYRDDPDFFMMIDIPMSVIDERIKYRVVCPNCNNSRNIKLLITKRIEYDESSKSFHLLCDNPNHGDIMMVRKEGDDLGIKPIRERLEKDEEILRKVFEEIHGVPKIMLRNHVPAAEADKYFDRYELTPEYVLSWDEKKKKVEVEEKPWTVKDDNGVESYSLLAPPVAVTLIKQLSKVLNLL